MTTFNERAVVTLQLGDGTHLGEVDIAAILSGENALILETIKNYASYANINILRIWGMDRQDLNLNATWKDITDQEEVVDGRRRANDIVYKGLTATVEFPEKKDNILTESYAPPEAPAGKFMSGTKRAGIYGGPHVARTVKDDAGKQKTEWIPEEESVAYDNQAKTAQAAVLLDDEFYFEGRGGTSGGPRSSKRQKKLSPVDEEPILALDFST